MIAREDRILRPEDDTSTYIPIETQLAPLLLAMEDQGYQVNPAQLAKLGPALTACAEEIYRLAGYRFPLSSRAQLLHTLYERLRLPPDNGPTRADTTTLEWLATLHPLPGKILEHRELTRLHALYVLQLPALLDDADRLHASFNLRWSLLGRITADPDLPNTTPPGQIVRQGVLATPGWLLIGYTYRQPALWTLAHLAGDTALQAACASGDGHAAVAQILFGDTTPAHRAQAKAVNYSIIHSVGKPAPRRDELFAPERGRHGLPRPELDALSMANGLRIPQPDAIRLMATYHAAFPELRPFTTRVIQESTDQLAATTAYGRRRSMPRLPHDIRNFHRRFAFAYRIYGSVADLMKATILALTAACRAQHLQTRVLFEHHDQIVLEAPQHEHPAVLRLLEQLHVPGPLPRIPVTLSTGACWADLNSG